MRTLLLLTLATGAFGLAAATGTAQKLPKDATLSINVAPSPITFGSTSIVTGEISTKQAGVRVILEVQPHPYTGKFTGTGTAVTDANGSYTFSVSPPTSTRYRVTTEEKPAVTSAEATLLVAWRVGLSVSDRTPSKGERVRFRGAVRPTHTGNVAIQRKTASGFKTVKTVALKTATGADRSTYSTRIRVRRTGRYRSVVLGDGAHETGYSPLRRLVVG